MQWTVTLVTPGGTSHDPLAVKTFVVIDCQPPWA
jgi:hypothetical protein